ncbi:hypothetical protein N9L89_00340 [Gammaproteobacteria bacterium]|nr:hypothetical protein [Gammaproteobacteria bacterium]
MSLETIEIVLLVILGGVIWQAFIAAFRFRQDTSRELEYLKVKVKDFSEIGDNGEVIKKIKKLENEIEFFKKEVAGQTELYNWLRNQLEIIWAVMPIEEKVDTEKEKKEEYVEKRISEIVEKARNWKNKGYREISQNDE